MPRTAANITQADVARVIRAAKQAGAAEVIVKVCGQDLIVRFTQSSTGIETTALAPRGEIVL